MIKNELFEENERKETTFEDYKVDDNISFLEMSKILEALNSKNFKYYDNFGDNDQTKNKNWQGEAYPALRWYSARGEDKVDFAQAKAQGRKKGDGKGKWPSKIYDDNYTGLQLELINEVVNLHFWDLSSNHPKLTFLLMCCVGLGKIKPPNSNIWLGMPKTKKGKNKFHNFLLNHVNKGLNLQEMEIYTSIYNTKSKMKSFLEAHGLQDSEIKEILDDTVFNKK